MEHRLELEQLDQAWAGFKGAQDPEARNALVLHYTSLVRVVAAKIGAQLPRTVDREDLVSYGVFGLLDAIDKYDPSKQVRFETYAVTRIRGSIFDEIRGLDWVPRTIRAKARDIEHAEVELHATLGRPPQDPEVAAHLGVTLAELWHTQAQAHAGQIGSFYEELSSDRGNFVEKVSVTRAVFDPASNPEDLFATQEVAWVLAEAIDAMPQRFKTILVLYYLHSMTLAEIGEVLGVTESRVCQLQSKLLQTLHGFLAQGLAAAA